MSPSPARGNEEAWPGFRNLLYELQPDGGVGEHVRNALDEEGWRWAKKVARDCGHAVKDASEHTARLRAENKLLRAKLARSEERLCHLRAETVSHIKLTSLEATRGNVQARVALHCQASAAAILAHAVAQRVQRRYYTSLSVFASRRALARSCETPSPHPGSRGSDTEDTGSIPPPPSTPPRTPSLVPVVPEVPRVKALQHVRGIAGLLERVHRVGVLRGAYAALLRHSRHGGRQRQRCAVSGSLLCLTAGLLRQRYFARWQRHAELRRSDPFGDDVTADQMLRDLSVPTDSASLQRASGFSTPAARQGSVQQQSLHTMPPAVSDPLSPFSIEAASFTPIRVRDSPAMPSLEASVAEVCEFGGTVAQQQRCDFSDVVSLRRSLREAERQRQGFVHELSVHATYAQRLEAQLSQTGVLVDKQKDVIATCEAEAHRLRAELETERQSAQYQLGVGIRRQVEELTAELACRTSVMAEQQERIAYLEAHGVSRDQRRRNAALIRRRTRTAGMLKPYVAWMRFVAMQKERRMKTVMSRSLMLRTAILLQNKNDSVMRLRCLRAFELLVERRRSPGFDMEEIAQQAVLKVLANRLRLQCENLVAASAETLDCDRRRAAFRRWHAWSQNIQTRGLLNTIVRLRLQMSNLSDHCGAALEASRDTRLQQSVLRGWMQWSFECEATRANIRYDRAMTQCLGHALVGGSRNHTRLLRRYYTVWSARGTRRVSQKQGVQRMESSWWRLLLARYFFQLGCLVQERRQTISRLVASRATKKAEPVRFQDPTTGYRVMFALSEKGGLRYTVNGEARPIIRELDLHVQGTFSFPGVHPRRGVTIPVEDLHAVLPRMRELVNSTDMSHNLGMLQPLEERLYLERSPTPARPSYRASQAYSEMSNSPQQLPSPSAYETPMSGRASPARSRRSSPSQCFVNTFINHAPWVPPPGHTSPSRSRATQALHRTPRVSRIT